MKDDLYGVFPYKGNLHCHTADSDGRYSPQETLCIAREAGFDFTAFSEHRMFTDHSTDCAEIISKLGIALFRAEEVHSLPLWICHILSFGASSGISDMQNNASYQEKVSAAMHYFSDISEEWRSYAAQFMVINDLIKLHGGVSILCHLFWMHSGRFNVPPELTSVILKRVSFDAVEAVSSDAGNVSLANASLMEFSASGCRQVCVAGSDWHGCRGERMGEAFNIVFARKCTESDIAGAIKAGRCVAVYGEENPVVYGDFRLVKYACFLLRNFYPLRDLNAERLGVLMLSAMGGETAFLAEIATLKIQLELQLKMLKG